MEYIFDNYKMHVATVKQQGCLSSSARVSHSNFILYPQFRTLFIIAKPRPNFVVLTSQKA